MAVGFTENRDVAHVWHVVVGAENQQNDEKVMIVTTSVSFARIASTPSAIFEKLSASFAPRIGRTGAGSTER
jgi:hypothetical protein